MPVWESRQTRLASPELVRAWLTGEHKRNYASAALGWRQMGVHVPRGYRTRCLYLASAASWTEKVLCRIFRDRRRERLLKFAGGFVEGGKDYSGEFAKIQAQLARKNQRLAMIESRLDMPRQTMRKNPKRLSRRLRRSASTLGSNSKPSLKPWNSDRLVPARGRGKPHWARSRE